MNYINTYLNLSSKEVALVLFLVSNIVLFAVFFWKVFQKGGLAGWKCLVPFYNLYCLTVIARLPWWYFLLMLIPWVGGFIFIYVYYKITQNFWKVIVFFLCFFFLCFFFLKFIFFIVMFFLTSY